jgi:hypothetical protein
MMGWNKARNLPISAHLPVPIVLYSPQPSDFYHSTKLQAQIESLIINIQKLAKGSLLLKNTPSSDNVHSPYIT